MEVMVKYFSTNQNILMMLTQIMVQLEIQDSALEKTLQTLKDTELAYTPSLETIM